MVYIRNPFDHLSSYKTGNTEKTYTVGARIRIDGCGGKIANVVETLDLIHELREDADKVQSAVLTVHKVDNPCPEEIPEAIFIEVVVSGQVNAPYADVIAEMHEYAWHLTIEYIFGNHYIEEAWTG